MNSSKGSIIFCTQYNNEEWYGRIDPEFDEGSPISEAIMDRITNNAYELTRHELAEANELCHGNWIEIQHLREYIDVLKATLTEHGIEIPVEY